MTARSSRVTLVVPPALMTIGDNDVRDYLGLGYLAAVLRQRGHAAGIVDSAFSGLDYDGCVKMVLGTDPAVVGLTGPYVIDLVSSVGVARRLRRAGFRGPILVGGQAASHSWENVLKSSPEVDAVCVGEGETTLPDLIEAHAASGRIEPVSGFAVREGDRFVFSPPPPLVALDNLPFPVRDNVETDGAPSTYAREGREGASLPYPIEGSRGCPYACSYCSVQSFFRTAQGPAWRGRSPENVLEEITYLRSRWGAKSFMFCDDNFLGSGQKGRERVVKLAGLLAELRPAIQFIFECRVTEVDPELFGLLKRAGLAQTALGVESGIAGMLDRFNKRATVADNVRALEVFHELGIRVHPNFMFCDPDTTVADMEELLIFLTRTRIHRTPNGLSTVFRNRLGLFAGTASYAHYQAQGITKPWRFEFLSPEEQRICDQLDGVRDYEFSDPEFGLFYSILQRRINRLLSADGDLKGLASPDDRKRWSSTLGSAGFHLLETLVRTAREGRPLKSAEGELDAIVDRVMADLPQVQTSADKTAGESQCSR